jgi:hypothetical protein
MGWLWLLLGGFWSLMSVVIMLDRAPVETNVIMSRTVWWQEVIGGILEMSIFVASALCGVALLRRWRWSRLSVWILGSLWLLFSILMVSCASGTFAMRFLWFGPSLALALYSLCVLWLARLEPNPV